ncbi:CPBP family intramembrane glutamic endopeptidase [Reichenbachiella sp.]|uniref:CPBP family intramembrane glutamic endopeptidase n=1 Tax=Reichenbachiella sp. TaxID=2184521 RepID=UPI003B5C53E1
MIEHLDVIDYRFARKVMWRGKSFFTLFLPILFFYYWYEKKRDETKSWYGLTLKQTDFRPYGILLLVVVIGIGLASFLSDLTNYYPRYIPSGGDRFAEKHELAGWIPMLIYEGVYGANFLNVELFFRGFLVIGFARVLGGQAVLAMVGSYMFLHYGKPITEAISSVFGGYLIGILAFYSKRIWGGVILHIALAWSMEFFAWLQRLYGDY